MIMGTVKIDEVVAKLLQDRERRGAAVDELAVRARGGKDALDQELAVFAGLHALLLKFGIDRARVLNLEDGLDSAAFGASPDQRFVGPFSKDELERADDDGLAGASLAGNDDHLVAFNRRNDVIFARRDGEFLRERDLRQPFMPPVAKLY